MTPAAAQPQSLDLFAWRQLSDIEAERVELMRRIALLPRYNHHRLELQARLKDLTTRELQQSIAHA